MNLYRPGSTTSVTTGVDIGVEYAAEAAINTADHFLVEQGFFEPSDEADGMRLVSWREQEY